LVLEKGETVKRVIADVVLGLQFGDEGKGKVVHSLASSGDYTHVMRFNGGSNAGHTIYHNGEKFVTHLVPAGVFYGIKSIVGGGCVVDIMKLVKEIRVLEKAGIDASSLVRVASNAHAVQTSHVNEEAGESAIGTTRTGNGPAYRDKHARSGMRVEDSRTLESLLVDPYDELWKTESDSVVLMEGAQGFGLDIDWGDYPYVSSSNCTVAAAVGAGVPPQNVRRVIGVAKPYVTYVGAKEFAGDHPALSEIQRVGAEFGATTGRPRQCNWLNLPELVKAANVNGVHELIFNKTDVFEEVGVFQVIVNDQGGNAEFESIDDFKAFVKNYLMLSCPALEKIVWSSSPDEI
jgi:adenylosuccinate synthase